MGVGAAMHRSLINVEPYICRYVIMHKQKYKVRLADHARLARLIHAMYLIADIVQLASQSASQQRQQAKLASIGSLLIYLFTIALLLWLLHTCIYSWLHCARGQNLCAVASVLV